MNGGDDGDGKGPERPPGPRPEPVESAGSTGWLHALNSFLERSFLEADRETGC